MDDPTDPLSAAGGPPPPDSPETASAPPSFPPAATAGGSPPDAPNRSRGRSAVIAGISAAVIAIGGIVGASVLGSDSSNSTAGAATAASGSNIPSDSNGGAGTNGQFARKGAMGTVTNIDGSAITVKDQSGSSTKVVTIDDTTVTLSHTGTVDDIAVGDHVMVRSSDSSSGSDSSSVTAQSITDRGAKVSDDTGFGAGPGGPPSGSGSSSGAGSAPSGTPPNGGDAPGGTPPTGTPPDGAAGGFGGGMPTRGVVTAVDGSTITVKTTAGDTVTVKTTSDTTVTVEKSGAVSDLKVGDTVAAMGSNDNGTVTATTIREGERGFGGGPGGFGGPGGDQGGGPGGAPGGSSGNSQSGSGSNGSGSTT